MTTKTRNITYWIVTLWLALGMVSTALVQLCKTKDEVALVTHLGYPSYLLVLIGIWKMLGTIAILVPKLPLLKEWAYAGFFFAMSGAVVSHIVCADGFKDIFGPSLLVVLTVLSWYLRPADRKLV